MLHIVIYSQSHRMRALLAGVLCDGCHLLVASSQRALATHIKRGRIDRIVTDEVALFEGAQPPWRRLQRLAQGCEVVVVAYDMSALMVVELLSRGARQCLSLPSSPSVLRRKLLDL